MRREKRKTYSAPRPFNVMSSCFFPQIKFDILNAGANRLLRPMLCTFLFKNATPVIRCCETIHSRLNMIYTVLSGHTPWSMNDIDLFVYTL